MTKENKKPMWWYSLSATVRCVLTTSFGVRAGDSRKAVTKQLTKCAKRTKNRSIRALLLSQPDCTSSDVSKIFDVLDISEYLTPNTCPICEQRRLGKTLVDYLLPLIQEVKKKAESCLETIKGKNIRTDPFTEREVDVGKMEVWQDIAILDSIEKYLQGLTFNSHELDVNSVQDSASVREQKLQDENQALRDQLQLLEKRLNERCTTCGHSESDCH